MLWIGLTGGLGTGKSTVAEIIRENGHTVIDADELSHLAISPGGKAYQKVIDEFGKAVLKNGKIDRSKLGEVVFQDKSRLRVLEEIIHPIVKKQAEERRSEAQARDEKFAFYDVPLLFEKNMKDLFDQVWVVYARKELQFKRLRKRNAWSDLEIENRLNNQISIDEKINEADVVISNIGSLEDLNEAVTEALKKL